MSDFDRHPAPYVNFPSAHHSYRSPLLYKPTGTVQGGVTSCSQDLSRHSVDYPARKNRTCASALEGTARLRPERPARHSLHRRRPRKLPAGEVAGRLRLRRPRRQLPRSVVPSHVQRCAAPVPMSLSVNRSSKLTKRHPRCRQIERQRVAIVPSGCNLEQQCCSYAR